MWRNGRLWVVLVTLFLSTAGFGLTLPALPFFVERLALGPGASDAQVAFHVGFLTAVYALSQMLFGPMLGAASDRWGRKPFLLGGLLGFAVAQAVFGLVTSLATLYAARALAALFAAALLTGGSAASADMAEDQDYLRAMASRGMAVGLGVVVGPALSGFLSRGSMHGHQMIGHLMLDGFSIPFFTAAALALASVPLVTFGFEERTVPPTPVDELEAVAGPLPSLLDLLVLSAAAQLALAAFEATFALYAKGVLSFGTVEIGWGYAVCGGVMAGFQGLLVGRLGGRLDRATQIAIGFAGLGLGLFSLAFTRSWPGVVGSITVLATGMALLAPNLAAAVTARRPGAPGGSLGLQNTALGVGQVIGPIAGSVLFTLGPTLPFLAASAVCVVISGTLWTRRVSGHAKLERLR
ncbi:MAG: MFS transporter [Gemmatimonadota bacterium]|nr:MFS transporter [Gemmatimonadota bacterium]